MKIKDVLKLFHGQWINCCLLVIFLVLTMSLSTVLFYHQQTLQEEQMHYASLWDGKQVYATYDTLYEHAEMEKSYFRDSSSQMRVQHFIDALESNTHFPYYICGEQYIYLKELQIPETCRAAESVSNNVYAHQVNEAVIRDFKPAIYDGRLFTQEEYEWKLNETIPVIVGYAWRDTLCVGEVFTGTFFSQELDFKVVGVMKKDTWFPLFDTLIYEDDYIIMPTMRILQITQNDDEDFFQKAFALQNTAGFFRLDVNQSINALVVYLDNLIQQYGMFEVKIMRIDQNRLLILAVSSDEHKQIYTGLMLALGLCALINMFVLSQAAVRRNARMLSIYYLAGASSAYIMLIVTGQSLILFIAAMLLSVGINVLFFPALPAIHIPTQIVLLFGMCACVIPAVRTFLLNPTDYMKKE